MKNCEIKGIIPPILTPMNNNFINQYKKDYDEEYASSFDDLLHH